MVCHCHSRLYKLPLSIRSRDVSTTVQGMGIKGATQQTHRRQTQLAYLFVNIILVPVPPFPTHLPFSFTHHFFLFRLTTVTTLLIHKSCLSPRLKTYLFHKSYPRSFTASSWTAFTNFFPDRFFWARPSRFLPARR